MTCLPNSVRTKPDATDLMLIFISVDVRYVLNGPYSQRLYTCVPFSTCLPCKRGSQAQMDFLPIGLG